MNSKTKIPYKPFDIVRVKGFIGIITEVSVNKSQKGFDHIIGYSIDWFEGPLKNAWFDHDELTVIGNCMQKMAENMCHPSSGNKQYVSGILNETLSIEER